MKEIYTEEFKAPQLNSPKNKEDKQVSPEKKPLPEDVVAISNQTKESQISEIYNQYQTYNEQLVSNIQTNPQEAKANYSEAKKLYAEIWQDLNTSNTSMQNMQNQLINCTLQHQ